MTAVPNPASPVWMNVLQRVTKQSDIFMAVLILTILAMLIVPLPEWILDTMLVINLAAAVMVLITTLYTSEPLQFSSFPSLRIFRIAVLWSSSVLFSCFTTSLRRSSVIAGIGTRITFPSVIGFSPVPDVRIAFSIADTIAMSYGVTRISVGSGVEICPICATGVSVP